MSRESAVADIRDQVSDLIYSYQPNGPKYPLPALLASLDRTRVLTSHGGGGGGPNKPGSKPPGNLEWPSLALEIRAGAVEWDARLRGSEVYRKPALALRGVADNCVLAYDVDLQALRRVVSKWHVKARVLLGYLNPDEDFPKQYVGACLDCRQRTVRGVPSEGTATCYACGSFYDQGRVRLMLKRYGH